MKYGNNENITIHYAEGKNLAGDIVTIKLKTGQDYFNFLKSVSAKDDKKTVYLFTSNFCFDPDDVHNEFSKEIYIESDFGLIFCAALRILDYSDTEIFLQEYESFEDAYRVALDMRETNKLRYNTD